MNKPDTEEIISSLSKKFNRIFCDRDFVCSVNEDLEIIKKSECCVLVFPVLGPIYLQALRYQAKILDFAVIPLNCGRFKSLAICRPNIIRKFPGRVPAMSTRHKRPERPLYVPPAQRRSRLAKPEPEKVLPPPPPPPSPPPVAAYFTSWQTDFTLLQLKVPSDLVMVYKYMYDVNSVFGSAFTRLLFGVPQTEGAIGLEAKCHEDCCVAKLQVPVDCEVAVANKCSVSADDVLVDLAAIDVGHFLFLAHTDKKAFVVHCEEAHDVHRCYNQLKNELSNNKTNIEVYLKKLNRKSIEQTNANKQIISVNNLKNSTMINKQANNNQTPTTTKKKNEHEEEKEIMRKTKENINRKTRPIMKYVDNDNDTLNIGKNDNVNNWEDLFDDDGRLQEGLFNEISSKVRANVTIVKANEDYSSYVAKPMEELEHIVELYDFPSTFATQDIVQAFSFIKSDAMYVKWVDHTHALLVLGSLCQAKKAIDFENPLIKARAMTAASTVSMTVALQSDLRPAMKRPQTNLQTARRLITAHLGAKSRLTREQNAKEREDLKAARELRKIAKQNEKDAWEGNFRSSSIN